jgi:lipoprotein NlpI
MIQSFLSRPIYVLAFMLFLAFLLYGGSLQNDYALDDYLVANETTELGWRAIPKAFKSGYMKHQQQNNISGYRPITVSTFAIEIAIFGKKASVSHAINVILYGLTGFLLYLFLATLFGNIADKITASTPNKASPAQTEQPSNTRLLAFISTLLFICHPIHSEAVINIKSRDELLAFLFALSAAFCLIRATQLTILRALGVLLLSALAVLSKNTATPTLLALLMGILLLQHQQYPVKRLVGSAASLLFGFGVYKFLGKTLSDKTTDGRIWEYIENPLFDLSWIERLPTGIAIMFSYLKLLVVPQPLLYYYGYNQVALCTWASPLTWLSLALHGALLVWAITQYKKRPIWSFALFFYLLHVAVYSNIIKPGPGIIAERFFYSGTLGFCIALAYAGLYMANVLRQRQMNSFWLSALLLCLLITHTVLIYQRIPAWKNLDTLLKTDMPHLSNSAKANLLYADALVKNLKKATMADWELAEKHYRRAIEIYPKYSAPYNNLGFFYLKTSRFAEANEILLQAQALAPHSSRILYNLGSASLKLGMTDKAQNYFEQAVQYEPYSDASLAAFGGLHDIYNQKSDTTAVLNNLIKGFAYQPRENFFYNELIAHYSNGQKLPYLKSLLYQVSDTLPAQAQKIMRRKADKIQVN